MNSEMQDAINSIRVYQNPVWTSDYRIVSIEQMLSDLADGTNGVEMCPDFQRGHVWTREQEVSFVENVLKRVVGRTALTVVFNCPMWQRFETSEECDLENKIVCLDGLQRLTALINFNNKIVKPFGLTIDELKGTKLQVDNVASRVSVQMFDFQTRRELLQYYLDFNSGGTPHSMSEIMRVREMLDECGGSRPSFK